MRYLAILFLIFIYSDMLFQNNNKQTKSELKAQKHIIAIYQNRANSYNRKISKKAQYKLAKFYQKGKLLKKDLAQYHYYIKLSADNGYKWAQFELANIYKKDGKNRQSFKMMKRSADQGHIWASYNLALMYFDGLGTTKNYKKSFFYMQRPVLYGYKKAQYAMAKMYYHGYGIGQDVEMAKEILNMAIEQKDTKSMILLADINYKDNQFVEALLLYSQASDLGDDEASFKLVNIYLEANKTETAIKLLKNMENRSQKARDKLAMIYLYKLNNHKKATQIYIKNEFLKSNFYIDRNLQEPMIWSELLY
jgi:TPR repeat protein